MRDSGRVLFHTDADAFFVSVAQRDDATLRGRPMVVAGHVVMCASYEARALGLHAGMPLSQLRRRWPGLRVVEFRPAAVQEASGALFALFRRFTPLVEPGSMEEAFLDVTERDRGDPAGMAEALRAAARAEVGLPVSVGVARTKLFAKLASRRAKPDGLVVVDDALEAHVRPRLPLDDLWGVGPTTWEKLHAAGLFTVADLAGWEETRLKGIVSTAMARRLLSIRDGIDDATIRLPGPRRSVSATRSMRSTRTRSAVLAVLGARVEAALARLDDDPREPHRIEVVVRFEDGVQLLERAALPVPTRDESMICRVAEALLARTGWEDDGRGVTLVGLTLGLPAPPVSASG